MHAQYLISADNCGDVLKLIMSSEAAGRKIIKESLVKSKFRLLLTQQIQLNVVQQNALAGDLLIAHLLTKSEFIFLGTDGTQEISFNRFFQEIGNKVNNFNIFVEIGAVYEGEPWRYPLAVVEGITHENASLVLQYIEEKLKRIQKIQHKLGLLITKLYDITTTTWDNTSLNTGDKCGLKKILEDRRLQE
jgi:hypothetical protein